MANILFIKYFNVNSQLGMMESNWQIVAALPELVMEINTARCFYRGARSCTEFSYV